MKEGSEALVSAFGTSMLSTAMSFGSLWSNTRTLCSNFRFLDFHHQNLLPINPKELFLLRKFYQQFLEQTWEELKDTEWRQCNETQVIYLIKPLLRQNTEYTQQFTYILFKGKSLVQHALAELRLSFRLIQFINLIWKYAMQVSISQKKNSWIKWQRKSMDFFFLPVDVVKCMKCSTPIFTCVSASEKIHSWFIW